MNKFGKLLGEGNGSPLARVTPSQEKTSTDMLKFRFFRLFNSPIWCLGMICGLFFSAAGPSLGETWTCAHRGDVRSAPENTLPALVSAVDKGAEQIEFDLQLSRDGEVVLMHDATLARTTGAEGQVGDHTLAELKEFDAGAWFGPEFAGTRIPTFQEALAVIPRSILCNCHLKGGPEVGAAAARILVEMDRLDHCFLAATVEQAAEARKVAPEIRICNMTRQTAPHTTYVEETIRLGCEFIQLLGSKENLKETVSRLHDHGVTVNFFHGNTESDIRILRDAGVDYILTDELDLCLRILGEKSPSREPAE